MKKLTIFSLFLVFVVLALLGALAGCTHEGPKLVEEATVLETTFSPRQHGDSTGFSTSGRVVFSDIDVHASYGVVFECHHGKFAVQGDSEKAQRFWKLFKKGDRARITYYEVIDDDTKEVVGRHVVNAEVIR